MSWVLVGLFEGAWPIHVINPLGSRCQSGNHLGIRLDQYTTFLETGKNQMETQNWETMALQMLTTVDLFNFIMFDDPRE